MRTATVTSFPDRLKQWWQTRRQSGLPTDEAIRPSLEALVALRPQVLDFVLAQRRHSPRPMAGGRYSAIRGRGLDFDELRAYQAGDDVRSMDWQVMARTGRPHTRLYREERERPLLLLVDLRLSMRFGSRQCFKSVTAARAAAQLAWAALASGDRIGGLVFNDYAYRVLRPGAGRATVLQWLRHLVELHAGDPRERTDRNALRQDDDDQRIDLVLAMRRLRRLSGTGGASLVHLLSDFHDLDETAHREFSELARQSDLMGTFVYDPLEAEPPPPGRYPVTDGGRTAVLDTGITANAQAYRERFARHQARVTELFLNHRSHLLRLSTANTVDESLRRLLRVRLVGTAR